MFDPHPECNTPDLPHVVASFDVDDRSDIVVWGILANHAEYAVAVDALAEYAEEADGVEQLFVIVAENKSGAGLAEQVRTDTAEMRRDLEEMGS